MCINHPKAKPGLSEIFAAMAGVTAAGITIARTWDGSGKAPLHPLADYGTKSAKLCFDSGARLLASGAAEKTQEAVALNCLSFLEEAALHLEPYESVVLTGVVGPGDHGMIFKIGGTVRDVLMHIRDLVHAERTGIGERAAVSYNYQGKHEPVFPAPYLPDYFKPVEKPVAPAVPQTLVLA
jgi:hypothetical protein